ncbi:hypothetical protein VNO78_16198 [Psophocarpus tetragonolobus]|uniref:Uncharacterized protein n=1 Tax=Psophocarpus tetragonolobus TaxID=3891 RepID=A0AAN9SFE6_PSOTE
MTFRMSHPFLFAILFVSLVLIAEPATGYVEPGVMCIGPCNHPCDKKCIQDCNTRCAAKRFKYGYCLTQGFVSNCCCYD